jgi:hypothetical protein
MKTTVIKTHTSRAPNGMSYSYRFEQILKIQPDSRLYEFEIFKTVISLDDTHEGSYSFGEISRWNGTTWKDVAAINWDELSVLKDFDFGASYGEGRDDLFEKDRVELLRIALEVCTNIDISQL